MLQYVRTVYQRIHELPRDSARARRPLALRVDVLEDRCTPASLSQQTALIATYLPVLHVEPGVVAMPTFNAPAPNGTATHVASLVRTDLFGGAVDESDDTGDDGLVAIEEPFSLQNSALDLKTRHSSDAEPTARPNEVRKGSDDASDSRRERHDAIEEYAACILLEYDAAFEAE